MPESNCVPSGTNCGIWFSTLSMLIVLEFSSRCASTVTIGLEASRSRRTMREPVTRISSVGSCACAFIACEAISVEIVDASTVSCCRFGVPNLAVSMVFPREILLAKNAI